MNPVPVNLAWPTRVAVMTQAIQMFKNPIHALEVGTWYGAGSTRIWLDNLPAGSTLTLVDSWKPYCSDSDKTDRHFDYAAYEGKMLEAYMATILAVRQFETANPGKLSIEIVRGDSAGVLGRMRDGAFDFIYIDGDHKYAGMRQNVIDAKRLANPDFAIICGDDLELLPTPELLTIARDYPDHDFLREPFSFHPGVMLALHEQFEQIGMENGFWWVFRQNGGFRAS